LNDWLTEGSNHVWSPLSLTTSRQPEPPLIRASLATQKAMRIAHKVTAEPIASSSTKTTGQSSVRAD
jgi:hypothetical protein